MSRWAVEMAEALRGDGSGGADGSWRFATVNTASPLTIKAHDQVISKYLYKSASLSLQAGDEVLVYETGVAFYILRCRLAQTPATVRDGLHRALDDW